MKFQLVILTVAFSCAGCAAYSLERRTVNQSLSVTDYRYREALHCLALVAANPAVLPPFALIADGTAQVTDSATVSSQTLWSRAINSFASETFMALWSRNPQPNWTFDPVVDYDQIQAIHCACRWALFGRREACNGCESLLASPLTASSSTDSSSEPHFDVAWRLERLPPCWFHLGRLKDVPIHACYKAHCHDLWIWVMPDGMEGLSQFTLVLQDIATRDPTNMQPPQVTIEVIASYSPKSQKLPNAAREQKTAPIETGKAPDDCALKDWVLKNASITKNKHVKREHLADVEKVIFDPEPNFNNVWNVLNDDKNFADSHPPRTNVSLTGGGAAANVPPGTPSSPTPGSGSIR